MSLLKRNRPQRLLNHRQIRALALDCCKEFGIAATHVRKSFLKDCEAVMRTYIRSQAIARVPDKKKTIS